MSHWILAPFLLEAVEVGWCYFFENWLMKLKWVNLLNTLGTINEQNYQSFYPSEQFTLDHFTMRHPVQPECTAYFIFRYILTIYLQAMNNLISKLEKVDARKMFDVPKIKRSCLKSWSNWIGWLLSWLFSFCEGRDCREDGKSRNTAARLEEGLHRC